MTSILIVEDDAAIRLLTRTRLSGTYHILEAENGEQGLEIFDHNHVDLVIADIMMPKKMCIRDSRRTDHYSGG